MGEYTRTAEEITGARWRLRVHVRGIVQGVGFRPFVYQLAKRWSLCGFVLNRGDGVVIEIEGLPAAIEEFLRRLKSEAPPLVSIADLEHEELETTGDDVFEIRRSQAGEFVFSPVPPDVAVCAECLAETQDRSDRRFEYVFTNCTNCGPRYSIILDVPYDRAQTTMATFALCEKCEAEYEDPANRRFHAQPNACPACGPHLWLTDSHGKRAPFEGARNVLEMAVDILRDGGIVAWKGLGGYQLACDALNGKAVRELRRRKHRNEKPFAVMVSDAKVAEDLSDVSRAELDILTGSEKPIVLLRRKERAQIAAEVAPGSALLGVMLPYTPMHDLLFRILEEKCGAGSVLVMTSGNMSEEPIVVDEAEAQEGLGEIADAFVHHNRAVHTRVDDSVLRVVDGETVLLRRARGYAPTPLQLEIANREVLACGAQQKSTFCLTKARYALLSQHLGDLENYETLVFFEQTLEGMQRLFHVSPQAVAHDLHPAYLSTQLAMKMKTDRRIGVQHHHAHIASCMAEHGLNEPVIGVAWDGTGYGTDKAVWGGEFLVADLARFERFAHLRNVTLAGGDAAVREPWRIARSYLRDAFDNVAVRGLAFPQSVPEASVRIVDAMLQNGVQTVETSSCGRLFDAVASIVGLYQTVSFEGQAAMALEALADGAEEAYGFSVDGQKPAQVDMRPMVRQIVDDVKRGEPVSRISARFHNTLVAIVVDTCTRMRIQTGLKRVCLSGGCFQNVRLLVGCLRTLRSDGFEVFFQQRVPCNDGGIALGQAAIACELLRREG
jgi:hydrogenase maturation protein HypF